MSYYIFIYIVIYIYIITPIKILRIYKDRYTQPDKLVVASVCADLMFSSIYTHIYVYIEYPVWNQNPHLSMKSHIYGFSGL
jgi:hypothetical protein